MPLFEMWAYVGTKDRKKALGLSSMQIQDMGFSPIQEQKGNGKHDRRVKVTIKNGQR
jgi:hypothetical protein